MFEYDKIDVSEGINFKKTGGLLECIICHYWHFININFKFQEEVCNSCHDLMQKAIKNYKSSLKKMKPYIS